MAVSLALAGFLERMARCATRVGPHRRGVSVGLTFARSVRMGPVRFNFTGSGIGVSTGIRGLRVGLGPRGAYINAGIGGFRYRTSLGGGKSAPQGLYLPSAPRGSGQSTSSPPSSSSIPAPVITRTEEHDTASVLSLTDSSGDALLQAMNEQAAKLALWPFVGGALLVLFWLARGATQTWPDWAPFALLGAGAVMTTWVWHRDKMRKLTVLFYEPDAAIVQSFSGVVSAASQALTVQRLRSILETSTYADPKYVAGASKGLKFGKSSIAIGHAPRVLANIDVPVLSSGHTTLAFYPDRVLAFRDKAVGAIDYVDLTANSFPSRFIEAESVPGDASVVDHTWQYVNKNGGPDKRFKNNRQLPICQCNRLHLSSRGGLDVRILSSRDGAFDAFAQAVTKMSSSGPF